MMTFDLELGPLPEHMIMILRLREAPVNLKHPFLEVPKLSLYIGKFLPQLQLHETSSFAINFRFYAQCDILMYSSRRGPDAVELGDKESTPLLLCSLTTHRHRFALNHPCLAPCLFLSASPYSLLRALGV
ncbi:hypothetical protein ACLOJK_030955 [Asimina triloba]